jgi:hypothetical protein
MSRLVLENSIPVAYDKAAWTRIVRSICNQVNAVSEGRVTGRFNSQNTVPAGTSDPHEIGDLVYDTQPSVTDGTVRIAWLCTAAGSPGTFTEVRAVTGVSVIANAVADASLPRMWISGLVPSQAADTSHDTTISEGECRDSTNAENLILASAITKRIDAAWAVGTDQGGLDGSESVDGTPDANTWYHIWLIKRSDTGVVDALYSESSSDPTMPTNYDYKRLIGSVLTDGSANIIAYASTEVNGGGLNIMWSDPPLDFSAVAQSTTAVTRTLTVPTGYVVKAQFNVYFFISGANFQGIYFSPLSVTDEAASATAAPLLTVADSSDGSVSSASTMGWVVCLTNTSAQIRSRATGNGSLYLSTSGWEWSRR